MRQIGWTKEEMSKLYNERYKNNKTILQISKILNKSKSSVLKKLKRTNWGNFHKHINSPNIHATLFPQKKWSQEEMIQLDSFLQSGKSYSFIAEKLKRSVSSIERKSQTTNWQAWRTASLGDESEDDLNYDEEHTNRLIDSLIVLCRHDYNRLREISKDEFLRKINAEEDILSMTYDELREKTIQKLDELGLRNPEVLNLEEGTYIIIGDSHGKHTKSKMFDLLYNVNKYLKATKIIHLGHILDDDNDISYNWGKFNNLIILAKIEELKFIQSQRNKFNFRYDIVRGGITIGNSLSVMNQDIISDYVQTSIRGLDSEIFDPQVIVNCHRLETVSKCSEESPQYFASPGCICEKHIIKTIKQIDFEDSKTVKMAFHGGFTKYRRMEHLNKYWNQGLLIVNVSKSGNHTIVPCFIKNIDKEYVTSYFNKIITSNGICKPDRKIFVHGDMHSPNHDPKILDIQEQICVNYGADILVNLGDTHDYRSLNHHEMDKGKVIFGDLMQESAQTYHILKRMKKWAKECHIIFGNHERFGKDFVEKFPQLASYLDFSFLCDLEGLGYKLTNLKNVLKIDEAKFVHGEMVMFGQPGTKLEKTSRTFGHDVFIGHVHYPSIRFGALSVGFAGKMDQGYNEPNSSSWIHGFGLCNQYKKHNFPTSIAILNYNCILNGKEFDPMNFEKWNIKNFKVKLNYITD